MVVWKGGAGNKAPYESTHIRVPVPIKDKVQSMVDDYKKSVLSGKPVSLDESPNVAQAIALLQQSLQYKANSFGKGKKLIEEGLELLKKQG